MLELLEPRHDGRGFTPLMQDSCLEGDHPAGDVGQTALRLEAGFAFGLQKGVRVRMHAQGAAPQRAQEEEAGPPHRGKKKRQTPKNQTVGVGAHTCSRAVSCCTTWL